MGHHFQRRIDGNLWVTGNIVDGEWKISVIDANSFAVDDREQIIKAITEVLKEESRLRTALWQALPVDVQINIRKGKI